MKLTKPALASRRPLEPNITGRILRPTSELSPEEPTQAELNYQATLDRQRLAWRSKPLRIELPTLTEKQRDPSLYKPLKRRSFLKRNPHQEWTVYDQCMANRNRRS